MESFKALSKREMYNDILGLRLSNQEEIERLKRELSYSYSSRSRILLDEKIRYDQELKSELIDLDEQVLSLSGFKIKNNGKSNR